MIFIHHGTGIENALPDIIGNSTLVKPPYENLKKDALRDLVENFSQRWPVDNAALLAGPIDSVDRGEVLDLLLKRLWERSADDPITLWGAVLFCPLSPSPAQIRRKTPLIVRKGSRHSRGHVCT